MVQRVEGHVVAQRPDFVGLIAPEPRCGDMHRRAARPVAGNAAGQPRLIQRANCEAIQPGRHHPQSGSKGKGLDGKEQPTPPAFPQGVGVIKQAVNGPLVVDKGRGIHRIERRYIHWAILA